MADLQKSNLVDATINEKKLGSNDEFSPKHSADMGQLENLSLDPKADRALTTKVDLKVLPILGLLYLICFLDRTNIGG